MRNVGHGSHGPKGLATDHTDRSLLPRIARTEDLLPRITPRTGGQNISLSNPWQNHPRSVSLRAIRGPKSVATDSTDQRSLPRITPITRTEHLSLKPAADRSPVRGLPCDPWPEVCCHASHGPKNFATDRTDRRPVATDHTDHTDRTVSLSSSWPIDPRSVAFRVVRGPIDPAVRGFPCDPWLRFKT